MLLRPLKPFATAALTATTTSSNAAIPSNAQVLEIQNAGDAVVFVRWGIGTQTAVTTDYPVLPGQSKVVTCEIGNNNVAVIAASGTNTVYVTGGEGV